MPFANTIPHHFFFRLRAAFFLPGQQMLQ